MNNKNSIYSLHGYQPVRVNEKVLSAELRSVSYDDYIGCCVRGSADENWQDLLTSEEQAELESKAEGEFADHNQRAAQRRRTSNLRIACHHRRFARRLFCAGERVWYGDGPPPWKNAS